MTENGHEAVTDLGEIIERTRPTRTISIPLSSIRADTLTPYELVSVGRVLDKTPQELIDEFGERGGWTSIELAQALAWVIMRRVEPDLSWQEAQRFAIKWSDPPDPTPAAGQKSRRPGTTSKSAGSGSPGSRRPISPR